MEKPNAQELVAALRSRFEPTDNRTKRDLVSSETLERCIERLLFRRGELGPVDAILGRALTTLDATEDWASMTDEQLLDHWNSTVEKLTLDFSRTPESWLDSDSKEFFRRSAVVFGVEDDAIHKLMRNFHKSPREARVAISLPIRRSSLFGYIDREINEMVDDVKIADPTESLRSLIRSVVSAV